MNRAVLAICLTLAACDEGSSRNQPPQNPANAMSPAAWDLLTVAPGASDGYAVNMPPNPSPHPEGFSFNFGPDAEPHYVTFRHGSLTGKTAILIRYRVEAAPETIIFGKECPVTSPSGVTLYFQKSGDDWRSDGGRWWATFATATLSGASEGEIIAPLQGAWTSVYRMTAAANPGEFASAKDNADRVGFTFGNCTGFGHGARATGPVTFVVTDFQVV